MTTATVTSISQPSSHLERVYVHDTTLPTIIMLIRVRSKDGNFRFELQPTSDIAELVDKILTTAPGIDPNTVTISNRPRGNEINVSTIKGRSLKALGLNHTDLVFVSYQEKTGVSAGDTSVSTTSDVKPITDAPPKRPWQSVREDPVDEYWRTQNGQISRNRDSRFCKHGANGMCDYCMPLEPYDAMYHKENNIKYLSYHAYLSKITPKGTVSATSQLPPLAPLSYKVKVPCPSANHPSWPLGICTSCQPSAITLQSQPFRMVDHLEIASTDIVDRFLQAWRQTGLQRFGWMIGRYAPYDKVPMGVKAVVEAIYEPPQQGELDGLTLGWPWEDEAHIRQLSSAASTPLTVIGCVFTDLSPTPDDRTKNVYKRHPQSYLLTSLEAIFAAKLQKANPTASKWSTTGYYSSRMVTAMLTASVDGQVDIAAYQVSEQAEAMVEADMIEASVDPGIVRVKEDDRRHEFARYVPDVFFSYKNEYGLEVKKSAKPCFPVEYLMVNVTHGFPQNPSPLFQSTESDIENRPGLEDQTLDKVMGRLVKLDAPSIQSGESTYKKRELARMLSDWHLCAFLGTTQLFSADDLNTMMRTVSAPDIMDDPSKLDAVLSTDSWQTLMTFTRESAPPARPSIPAPSDAYGDTDIPQEVYDQIAAEQTGPGSSFMCPHCTFENSHGGSDCVVCGLPL